MPCDKATAFLQDIWQQKYAEYMKTIPEGSKQYKHFYGWMYSEIYRGMREATN